MIDCGLNLNYKMLIFSLFRCGVAQVDFVVVLRGSC